MYVLEVRAAELIKSLTQRAAEQDIAYAAIVALIGAIGGHLHTAHLGTSFARAHVIPSEHHVAVPPHEQIVFALAGCFRGAARASRAPAPTRSRHRTDG
jgi:hypothetical protein